MNRFPLHNLTLMSFSLLIIQLISFNPIVALLFHGGMVDYQNVCTTIETIAMLLCLTETLPSKKGVKKKKKTK